MPLRTFEEFVAGDYWGTTNVAIYSVGRFANTNKFLRCALQSSLPILACVL
jgi:hypothetical protein